MPISVQPLATVDDLREVYESDIPDDAEDRLQRLLTVATAKLLRLRPALTANIAAGVVSSDLVTFALTSAVLRVLRSPGAYRSETAGEFSYTLNTSVASGLLTFTDEELADCTPPRVHRPAGVGSIRLAVGPPLPSGDCPW